MPPPRPLAERCHSTRLLKSLYRASLPRPNVIYGLKQCFTSTAAEEVRRLPREFRQQYYLEIGATQQSIAGAETLFERVLFHARHTFLFTIA